MINYFSISLILTFLITRSWAYFAYRRNNYFDSADNPKTLTGWLRIKTGFDWHHVHFGAIIFFFSSLWIYSEGFTIFNEAILGISFSMILDQIFPLVANWNYFSRKMFFVSFLLHLNVALLSIKIF